MHECSNFTVYGTFNAPISVATSAHKLVTVIGGGFLIFTITFLSGFGTVGAVGALKPRSASAPSVFSAAIETVFFVSRIGFLRWPFVFGGLPSDVEAFLFATLVKLLSGISVSVSVNSYSSIWESAVSWREGPAVWPKFWSLADMAAADMGEHANEHGLCLLSEATLFRFRKLFTSLRAFVTPDFWPADTAGTWCKVYSCCILAVLSIMPMFCMVRQTSELE